MYLAHMPDPSYQSGASGTPSKKRWLKPDASGSKTSLESATAIIVHQDHTIRDKLLKAVEKHETNRAALHPWLVSSVVNIVKNFCLNNKIMITNFTKKLQSISTNPSSTSHFDEVKQTMKKLAPRFAQYYCQNIDKKVKLEKLKEEEAHIISQFIKDYSSENGDVPDICIETMEDFCAKTGVTVKEFIREVLIRSKQNHTECIKLFIDTMNTICPENEQMVNTFTTQLQEILDSHSDVVGSEDDDSGCEGDELCDSLVLSPFEASATKSDFNAIKGMNGDQELGVSGATKSDSPARRGSKRGRSQSPPSSSPHFDTEDHQVRNTIIKSLTSQLRKNNEVKQYFDEAKIDIKDCLQGSSTDQLCDLEECISSSGSDSKALIEIVCTYIFN